MTASRAMRPTCRRGDHAAGRLSSPTCLRAPEAIGPRALMLTKAAGVAARRARPKASLILLT